MPYKKGTAHKFKGRTKLTCKECGSIYFRTPSASKNSKYCSIQCKKPNNRKKENHPMWRGGKKKIPCFSCGQITERAENTLKGRLHIFCSCRCRMLFYRKSQKTTRTDIEISMENILISLGIKYQSQKLIKRICIPDFYLPDYNIAIFCDGEHWHNFPLGKPRDLWQINELSKIGIRGIRFWGKQIQDKNFKKVLASSLKLDKKNV